MSALVSPREALLAAGRLIHEGRGAEAIAILERTGELPPETESTRLRYLAIATTQQGQPEHAIRLLDQAQVIAVQRGNASDRAWIARARAGAHLRANSPREAARALEEAVAACDDNAVADVVLLFCMLADLGEALAQSGQANLALEAFDRSLALSRPFVDAASRASRYAAIADAEQAAGNSDGAEYYGRKSVYVREDIRMLDGIARARERAAELRTREVTP